MGGTPRVYAAIVPLEQPQFPARGRRQTGPLAQLVEGAQRITGWYRTHEADIRRWGKAVRARSAEDASADPWSWLLTRVDAFTGMAMVGALEAEPFLGVEKAYRGRTLGLLVSEAVCTTEVLAEVRAAVESSSIDAVRRRQASAAISFQEEGRHDLAVPLLINALEGAIWFHAEADGLIVRDRRGKWTEALSGRVVGGVEGALELFAPHLDGELRNFLKKVVYGGTGDPFRHGSARTGWELRSGLLTCALIGWLERDGLIDSRVTIREAFKQRRNTRRASGSGPQAGP